ncbi:MAG: DUF2057 domain-containing protein [Moraxella sp.]|nr:DUF2057 domain-containing protein [Moraxella sp.]
MKKSLLFIISTIVCTTAFADVKLSVDEYIKVTAINGQEIHHNLLQPLKREFTLQAGRHVITARYDRLFDLPSGNHDYLKSGNITVMADLSDNQNYQLIMPNQPNSYKSAKEYAKSPSLAITHNGNIIAQESTSEKREGILSGLGGIFGKDKGVVANQQTIASLQTQPQTPQTAPATAGVSSTQKNSNLDGFMQLWLNSSDEEREKIRQWVEK